MYGDCRQSAGSSPSVPETKTPDGAGHGEHRAARNDVPQVFHLWIRFKIEYPGGYLSGIVGFFLDQF